MRRAIGWAAVMVFASLGCSGSQGPPLPATVPAKGSVALPGGQPLKAGRVVLNPQDSGGVEAFGDLKPDGTFTLTTYKQGDGAVPGHYIATISPYNYATRAAAR